MSVFLYRCDATDSTHVLVSDMPLLTFACFAPTCCMSIASLIWLSFKVKNNSVLLLCTVLGLILGRLRIPVRPVMKGKKSWGLTMMSRKIPGIIVKVCSSLIQ